MSTIHVHDLINKDLAVAPEDGKLLFMQLNSAVENKVHVVIDFSGLNTITTAFFNASLGNLYVRWTADILNQYIQINGKTLTPLQRKKARMVMDNAKTKLTEQELHDEMDGA